MQDVKTLLTPLLPSPSIKRIIITGDEELVKSDILLSLGESGEGDLLGFTREELREFVRLHVVQVTDPKATNYLLLGYDTLASCLLNSSALSEGTLQAKMLSTLYGIKSISDSIQLFLRAIQVKTLSLDNQTSVTSFNIAPDRMEHLAYFTFCSFDNKAFEAKYGISKNSLPQMLSKAACDIVYDDGEKQSYGYAYYTQTRDQWKGPVFPVGEHWYGGYDSNDLTVKLTREAVYNAKLQDFRNIKKESSPVVVPPVQQIKAVVSGKQYEHKTNSLFSPLYQTQDENMSNNLFFMVDYERVVRSNSILRSLFERVPALVEEMVNRVEVDSIVVYRHRKRRGLSQTIQEADDLVVSSQGDRLGGKYDKNSIQRLTLPITNAGKGFAYYTVHDHSFSLLTGGEYEYSVKIDLQDPAFSFLQEASTSLRNAHKYLSDYKETMEQESEGDLFTPEQTRLARKSYSMLREVTPWVVAPIVYKKYARLFKDLSKSFLLDIFSLVSPETGSLSGVQFLLASIEELLVFIEKNVPHDTSKDNIVLSSRSSPKREITIKHKFENTTSIDKSHYGRISYLPIDQLKGGNFPYVSSRSYMRRVLAETQSFYADRASNINLTIDGISLTTDDTVSQSEYSFLTPYKYTLPSRDYRFIKDETSTPFIRREEGAKEREIKKSVIQIRDMSDLNLTSLFTSLLAGSPLDYNARKPTVSFQSSINYYSSIGVNVESSLVEVEKVDTDRFAITKSNEPSAKKKFFNPSIDPLVEETESLSKEGAREEPLQILSSMAMLGSSISSDNFLNGGLSTLLFTARAGLLKVESDIDNTKRLTGPLVNMTEVEYRSLPNQIKALLLQVYRPSVLSKNSLLSFTNTQTEFIGRTAIAIRHSAVGKVVYLSSFELDKDGKPLISKPVWQSLDRERYSNLSGNVILAMMQPYSNQRIGHSYNSNLSKGVVNSVFLLQTSQLEDEQLDFTLVDDIEEVLAPPAVFEIPQLGPIEVNVVESTQQSEVLVYKGKAEIVSKQDLENLKTTEANLIPVQGPAQGIFEVAVAGGLAIPLSTSTPPLTGGSLGGGMPSTPTQGLPQISIGGIPGNIGGVIQ